MKHFGSVMEFTHERNADILRAYRREIAAVPHIRLADIGRRIALSPASRFWVSGRRAATVCSQLLRGIPVLDSMRPEKRAMFREIFRRVSHILELAPSRRLLLVAEEVVNSPAPRFFMEPASVIQCLCKIRNEQRRNRLKLAARR